MRVSSFQIHQQAANQLQTLGSQAADTQTKIATGKRLNTPSDDPIGAAKVLDLSQEMAAREQYLQNNDAVDVQLALTDSVLSQVTDLIQRVQELTIQAGSGVSTQEDRSFISGEINARLDELVALANMTNASGEYLFSGYQSRTVPFTKDVNGFVYNGDSGVREIQVDRSQYVASNNPGDNVFVNVQQDFAIPRIKDGVSDNARILDVKVVDQEVTNSLAPDDLVIEFNDPDLTNGLPNYTIRRSSDNRVVEGLSNIVITPGEPIAVAGMEINVIGALLEGERFVVGVTEQQSVFDTIDQVASGLLDLSAESEPEEFQAMIDRAISGLNSAADNIISVRAEIGTRFNTLEASRTLHEDVTLQLTEVRSNIEDLDFTKAVSDLAYQSFVLEAAQQSFIRINSLSLFNRL